MTHWGKVGPSRERIKFKPPGTAGAGIKSLPASTDQLASPKPISQLQKALKRFLNRLPDSYIGSLKTFHSIGLEFFFSLGPGIFDVAGDLDKVGYALRGMQVRKHSDYGMSEEAVVLLVAPCLLVE